jgi:glycosyltransferase involved in cell wall biosynthesis
MRVAIDAHAIGTHAGGNETYVRGLLIALRDHAQDIDPIALQSQASINEGEVISGIETVPIPFAETPLRALWGIGSAARKARADLLHAQYFVPPMCPVPSVVSIHDIAWRTCPDTLPRLLRMRLESTTRGSLRRANRILTLTNAVREEIQQHYNVETDRIDIVAPYPDAIFAQSIADDTLNAVREKHDLPDEYILYCGAMQPRKNLVRLARAVAALPDAPPLVITGPRIWRTNEVQLALSEMNLGDRLRFLNYVDRNDLPSLMQSATIFAYIPSYEGFGLPVLEALACGTPVLASDIPSLREVAGEAAQFCNPNDDNTIQDALGSILQDESIQTHLEQNGPQQATQFTPQSMAKAASDAYRQALT